MINHWNETELEKTPDDLALRVYSSRLLGKDKTLVLHGGGNTSVKIVEKNLFGDEESILYVKGSGWDLETIQAAGYSPVKLNHLKLLSKLPSLSDPEMVNELVINMTRSSAPVPSVEAILHAIIPYKFVDHTHANSVITITNSPNGEKIIREIYGDQVIIVPYVMPGFDLAKLCADCLEQNLDSNKKGMVLLNHGIFSFGETAKESYNRMIDLVALAESYLKSKNAWDIVINNKRTINNLSLEIAELRKQISIAIGKPIILCRYNDPEILSYTNRSDINKIANQGPATPDHVIRTKRVPMIGRDLKSYIKQYKSYFEENDAVSNNSNTMLDPAPRVILDPEIGMCTVGRSVKNANIVADIYKHTIQIIQRAELLGGYRALPSKDIFDVEYWDLEQAKLKKDANTPVFSGEVALVTGAASGIGKACVDSLLSRGTAVIGLDINPNITKLYSNPNFKGILCDIRSTEELKSSLQTTIDTFGGLDILILNAGIFPGGCKIADLDMKEWRNVMNINLDSSLELMNISHPYLCLAPKGGRVVIIGSKNVPAPGPGAASYSASKAALNQIARVAALEWGEDNIRINSVHPNAVFDTAIWTPDILSARAKHYGLTVEQYKKNNILKTEVTSFDVSELVAEMCGYLFSKTTGAQVPIDGGNERVI